MQELEEKLEKEHPQTHFNPIFCANVAPINLTLPREHSTNSHAQSVLGKSAYMHTDTHAHSLWHQIQVSAPADLTQGMTAIP